MIDCIILNVAKELKCNFECGQRIKRKIIDFWGMALQLYFNNAVQRVSSTNALKIKPLNKNANKFQWKSLKQITDHTELVVVYVFPSDPCCHFQL